MACARLGMETIMFTVSVDSIALMPCNPNVGGSSKGHLVRAGRLGGEMGKNIDKTFIQSKMLQRVQGARGSFSARRRTSRSTAARCEEPLKIRSIWTVRQAEVSELVVEDGVIRGVKTFLRVVYRAKAVVLCTGTLPARPMHFMGM